MPVPAITSYTYDAYLALDAEPGVKYEYHDGFIVAMAGGTAIHSLIASNTARFLGNALDKAGKPCRVYNSDLRVHIAATRRTFYPDASVACEDPRFSEQDPHALVNPLLIVEVLSESTAGFDMGLKFAHYRRLPSLRQYVLISQEAPLVHTYYRADDTFWEIRTIEGLDHPVELKAIGCTLQMRDLYRLVPDLGETPIA
jgi:Uma2 family endonuclease